MKWRWVLVLGWCSLGCEGERRRAETLGTRSTVARVEVTTVVDAGLAGDGAAVVDAALAGDGATAASTSGCEAVTELGFVFVRPWVRDRDKPIRARYVMPALDVMEPSGKRRRIYLPACNEEYPSCETYRRCSELPLEQRAALATPTGTQAAVQCEGRSTTVLALVDDGQTVTVFKRTLADAGAGQWSSAAAAQLTRTGCRAVQPAKEVVRHVLVDL